MQCLIWGIFNTYVFITHLQPPAPAPPSSLAARQTLRETLYLPSPLSYSELPSRTRLARLIRFAVGGLLSQQLGRFASPRSPSFDPVKLQELHYLPGRG